jgi:hypothetical protein
VIAGLPELLSGNTGKGKNVFVADDFRRAAIDHRSHCQLGLRGNADFANEHNIERRAEGSCDLGTHHSAAPRENKDNRGFAFVFGQCQGQLLSCFGAVSEWHDASARSFLTV